MSNAVLDNLSVTPKQKLSEHECQARNSAQMLLHPKIIWEGLKVSRPQGLLLE